MSRKRSWVWSYAKVVEENKVKCFLCKAHISYCGSPSAIANHLKALHKLQPSDNVTYNIIDGDIDNTSDLSNSDDAEPSQKMGNKIKIEKDVCPESAEGDVDNADDLPSSEDTEPSHKRKKKNKIEKNVCPERQESITQAIATFVSTYMEPLSLVSSESFQDFMKILEPSYKIPCEQIIRSRLQVLYNKGRSIIERKLTAASSVSLTVDEWYSRAKDRYIFVDVQTLDDDCNLQHFTLCNEVVEERTTTINTADSLKFFLINWNLIGKVHTVVHDSTSAMELANSLVETENNILCVAHLIQLVVKDCIVVVPEYEAVCKKAAKVVAHFRHSDVAIEALSKRQEQLEMKKERLVQSCPTRWNSTFYMCQSLLRNKSAIELVLNDRQITTTFISKNLEISEEEWSIMERMVEVLKPFQVATTVLCNEKTVTSSLVMPIIYGLKTKHMITDSKDDYHVQLFKTVAISSLDGRFYASTNLTPLQISCFLDPRYKSLLHEDELIREKIRTFVRDAVAQSSTVQETADDNSSKTALDFLLQCNSMSSNNWEVQFERYIAEPQINYNFDPLVWWKRHKDSFPLVFKQAQKYLSIPATSAISERSFSTTGNIVTLKRSCLKPENVNLLTFLYQNHNILQEIT